MGTLGDPETQRKRAFASAVRSLTRRPRTRVEIEDFLAKREYSREVVAQTIERLVELNYLDDAAVADVVVREAERRNLGSRRVAQKLSQRGVPSGLREPAVASSADGDLERARALLEKRYPEGLHEGPRVREKALRLLVGRGFPYPIARQAVGLDRQVDA